MTYATMAASGQGRLVIWLRIAGYPWVFGTEDLEPNAADAWYWSGATRLYTGVKPWLDYSGIQIDEHASFEDGTLDVGPVDVTLIDVAGGLTAMIADAQYRTRTRLSASITAIEVAAMSIDISTGFAASGDIWIDQECIGYDHIDPAPEFHILTRGKYGTVPSAHAVDTSAMPVIIPIVTDGPTSLAGRRANLYVAEVDSAGVVSASECLYRGTVAPDIEAEGGVVEMKLDHITGYFSRRVGQRMPSVTMRPGYCYCGGKLSKTLMVEDDFGAAAAIEVEAALTAGYYAADWALAVQWKADAKAALIAAGTTRSIELNYVGDRWRLESPLRAGYKFKVTVVEGDPLWALGFNPGLYEWSGMGVAQTFDAQNESRLFVGEVARRYEATKSLDVQVTDAAYCFEDLYATIGQSAFMRVESISNIAVLDGDFTITFEMSSTDRAHDDADYIAINDAASLIFRHVFAFPGASETVKTATQKCFHLFAGQSEPESWCVLGLEDDDFDWDEMDAALVGVPAELRGFYDAVTDPIAVGELLLDRLALCGIAPRITDGTAGTIGGKIGWVNLQTPHETLADSVGLDSAMWAIVAAAKVRTQLEGQPRLNNVTVRHSYDYRNRQWAPDIAIAIDPTNNTGKTHSADYVCRGLIASDDPAVTAYHDAELMTWGICDRLLGVQFGVLGRAAPEVSIGCTWTSRQLLIGDVVKVTHPCVVDTATGEVGITARLGIVTGRVLQVTDDGLDVLRVLLPPEMNVAPIAPCAKATTWTPATLTLAIPDTGLYCRTGETDLTYISSGDQLRFTEYGVEAPATFGPQKVDSVGANTIVLDGDPFGGAFPANGVWCHWASYDECGVDQKVWLFFGDASYSLGALADECNVWAL